MPATAKGPPPLHESAGGNRDFFKKTLKKWVVEPAKIVYNVSCDYFNRPALELQVTVWKQKMTIQ